MLDLQGFLHQRMGLPEAISQEFAGHFRRVEAPKRTLLTRAGEVERSLYLIESGVQRSYFVHKDKDVTFQFTYPPGSTGIPESFFLQEPSRFFLECLTPSVLWQVDFERMDALTQQYPEMARWRYSSVERLLSLMISKQMEQMVCTAQERFKAFMERSPHLFQMVPQKYIASYLGMSAETFSQMLNNVKLES